MSFELSHPEKPPFRIPACIASRAIVASISAILSINQTFLFWGLWRHALSVAGASSEPRAATIFATVVFLSLVFSSSMTWDMAAMVSLLLGSLFLAGGVAVRALVAAVLRRAASGRL